MNGEPKIEQQLRDTIRARFLARRTEEAYVMWYKQFVRFHNRRHPRELGGADIAAFLEHLAVERDVAVSTAERDDIRPRESGRQFAGAQ